MTTPDPESAALALLARLRAQSGTLSVRDYVRVLQAVQRAVQRELADVWTRIPTMRGNGKCDPVEQERRPLTPDHHDD